MSPAGALGKPGFAETAEVDVAPREDLGDVTVLFAPFAHTLGLRRVLCEVKVVIDGDRVRVRSIRNG